MEKEIALKLQNNKIYPHEAVEMRAKLAGLYSFYSEQYETCIIEKARNWKILREKHKSDASAEKDWETTETGINEIGLKLRLKSIEKMLSALKSIIDMANVDYHNTKH